MARKEDIESPYSKFRESILKKLVEQKFVKGYKIEGEKIKKLKIELLYKDGNPALTDVKLYSKPGRRWYVSYRQLRPVKGGLGCAIISTPKGILTDKEAKKHKVGGELLFEIW